MLLSYWTVPYVELKDKKLQLFYNLGMVAVLAYVCSTVFMDQGFLEMDDAEGFGRPTVRMRAHASKGAFCDSLACEDIDSDQAVLELATHEVLVTTMVRQLSQEAECTSGKCGKWRTSKVSSYFVQSVDEFELKIAHNAYCSEFIASCKGSEKCPFAVPGSSMPGRLLGADGKVFKDIPVGTNPTFKLKDWLAAAGLGLDNTSDALQDDDNTYIGQNDKQIPTYRFLGFALLVDVSYNGKSGTFMDYVRGKPPLTYDIRVNHIPHTLYKHREVLSEQHNSTTGRGNRELLRSAGIVIKVAQSGQCARFSLSALIEKLLVNMGMIGVLTSVIEFVWQFLYPIWGVDYNAEVYRVVDKAEAEAQGKAEAEVVKDVKSD
mmetsp:Transcript_4606/g.8028  ORF Transcript_4606/g.8028 Transcript_4606/m.8028 type:complete len:376 (+) Transcript_4606:100-1227(+)